MKWSVTTPKIAISPQKMNWGRATLLFLFLLFNLVIICIAALLVYISVHYYLILQEYSELLHDNSKNLAYLVFPLVIIITVALLLLLLALFGCISGICQVKFMFGLYAFMLVILLVLQVAGAVLIIVFEAPIENNVSKGMIENIHLYNHTKSFREAYDSIQRDLDCCGVKNFTDWGNNHLHIPQSCCKKAQTCDTCDIDEINTQGCLLKLLQDVHENSVITLCIIILFGVFEATGLFLSILLICCQGEKVKKCENLKDDLPTY
ncbi:Tetraspanin-6 isoform X1 [Oopsacas minuta]|uniref:Tetraspanin n=1 Tax=Oopsacas minuta TaxID=111878 RepID=A0AAV7JDV0_9METZ|nr:Tetraspanin-6 isoform X1 [Oopsacas minuta]